MPALTDSLSHLLHCATAAPNVPVHLTLKGGLHLWMTFNGADKIKFSIGRKQIPPSFTEWNTCCTHWPYPLLGIPLPTKSADEHEINHYLTGFIPYTAPTSNDTDEQTPPRISWLGASLQRRQLPK